MCSCSKSLFVKLRKFTIPPGGINDLSNISAISMVAVEESRMGNLTTLTSTRLEEPDPLDDLDMSKKPMEMFLDGCKVMTCVELLQKGSMVACSC